MLDYQWAIDTFQTLEYAQKKARLTALFEIFQAHSNAIQRLLPLLANDQMTEADMLTAYSNLVRAMESVSKKQLTKALSEIEKLHERMEVLKREEAEDRAKEDPEMLLNNL